MSTYFIAFRQRKTSLKIAEAQIVASSLDAKRQEWINALRNELTAVLALVTEMGKALAGKWDEAKPGFPELHSKFMVAFSKTELLINPLEKDRENLINATNDCYRSVVVLGPMIRWKGEYGAYRDLLCCGRSWSLRKSGR
jgi:hypothetical protein